MAAESTVKTTGIVSPIRTAGGSKVTWLAVAERAIQVALLATIVSAALFKYGVRSIILLISAGMVIAVVLGVMEAVEVGTEDVEAPITVTKTVTV